MLNNFYGFLIKSTGFSFEIFIIGKAEDKIAVIKLMPKIIKNCLIPKIANETAIFITLIIYILTNMHPTEVNTVARIPFIIAIIILSMVNIVKIFFPLEPKHLKIPIVGRLFTTLVAI